MELILKSLAAILLISDKRKNSLTSQSQALTWRFLAMKHVLIAIVAVHAVDFFWNVTTGSFQTWTTGKPSEATKPSHSLPNLILMSLASVHQDFGLMVKSPQHRKSGPTMVRHML